MGNISPVKHVF